MNTVYGRVVYPLRASKCIPNSAVFASHLVNLACRFVPSVDSTVHIDEGMIRALKILLVQGIPKAGRRTRLITPFRQLIYQSAQARADKRGRRTYRIIKRANDIRQNVRFGAQLSGQQGEVVQDVSA